MYQLFRRWKKDALFTSLNMSGLVTGLTGFLLLAVYVQHELSYDQHLPSIESMYRVAHDRMLSGSEERLASTPLALADPIATAFPEVQSWTRLLRESGGLFRIGEDAYAERNVYFADSTFHRVFNVPVVSGDVEDALSNPEGVVLSASTAMRFFGSSDVVGRRLSFSIWGRDQELVVGAVLADFPSTSHVPVDVLLPFATPTNLWNGMHGQDWAYSGAWTYVVLRSPEAVETMEAGLARFVANTLPVQFRTGTRFWLQPVSDIHLDSHLGDEIQGNGSRVYVWAFSIIAILILVVACVNYMNIATARSQERSREIGIRKAVGATRGQLAFQFQMEAFMLCVAAVLLAAVAASALLPLFRSILDIQISISDLPLPAMAAVLVLTAVVTGLAAGSYPAFFLASLHPVASLSGKGGRTTSRALLLRRIMVSGQFVLTMALFIVVWTVVGQTRYLTSADVGYETDNVVYVSHWPRAPVSALVQAFEDLPGVSAVGRADVVPGSIGLPAVEFRQYRTDGMEENERRQMQSMDAEPGYIEFYGLDVVEGRTLREADAGTSIVLNQTAVNELDWNGTAIGRQLHVYDMLGNNAGSREVIGVLRDFNMESLHNRIEPVVIGTRGADRPYQAYVVRTAGSVNAGVLDAIESAWNHLVPGVPADVRILADDQAALYVTERRLIAVLVGFSIFAIVVTLLGLLGLATYTTVRRTKEIGIRIVLGATRASIVGLITKEVLVVAVLSSAVALPLAWIAVQSLFGGYAYRIDMSVSGVLVCVICSVLLACTTVGMRAWIAAGASPATNLRSE